MSAERPEDIRAMMSPADFGSLVQYFDGSVVRADIAVLFQRPQQDIDVGSIGITADINQVRINAADLPQPPKKGDTLTVQDTGDDFPPAPPGAVFVIVDTPKADSVRHTYLCNVNPQ